MMPPHVLSIDALLRNVSQKLVRQNYLVATAESCTGGLLATYLTSLAGSSAWFERGFVTYTVEAKQEALGVRHDLIESAGVVSEAVACAMAIGALRHSHAQLALATTGLAGPEGDGVHAVGTVCIALAFEAEAVQSLRCLFSPNLSRQAIREAACVQALQMLLDFFS